MAFARQAPPTCLTRELRAGVGVPTQILLPCTDPNGDALTYAVASKATHGSLAAIKGASVTYRPKPGFKGLDAFGVTVSDGSGAVDDGDHHRARHARRHRPGRAPRRRPAQGALRHGPRDDRLRRPHRRRLHRRRDPSPRRPARPVIARTTGAGGCRQGARRLRAAQGAGPHGARGRRLAQGDADRDRPRQERQRRHARPQRRAARHLARSKVAGRSIAASGLRCPDAAAAHRARALAALPATASAALDIGIQDDAFLSSAEPNAWPLARELRPDVIRYNVDWASVARTRPREAAAPGDPAYDWAATDGIVRTTAAQGARVLLTLVQAPAWANGGGLPRRAPLAAGDYGTFCRAVATRYSGSYVPAGATEALPARRRATRSGTSPTAGSSCSRRARTASRRRAVMARLMRACAGGIHAVSPGRAGRARPAREPRRPGRHRADRLPRALPRRGRAAARRRRAQSVSRQPPARSTAATSARRTARSRCATSTGSRARSRRPTARRSRSG